MQSSEKAPAPASGRSGGYWARFKQLDPLLFFFLLAFTVDKVAVKAVALAAAAIWLLVRGDLKTYFKQVPPFYWLLPVFEVLRFFIGRTDFNAAHGVGVAVVCLYWLAGGLGFLFLKNRTDARSAAPTLEAWFGLNAVVSILQLVHAIWASGSLNPYALDNPQYGNSTGDVVKGVLLGPCYLNAFINTFFVFYFLKNRRYSAAFLASLVVCLTTSNFVNLAFLPVLWVYTLFNRHAFKSAVAQTLLMVAFYTVISNGNLQYISDSIETAPAPTSPQVQTEVQHPNLAFDTLVARPAGKLVSFRMTAAYCASGWQPLLFGAGGGQFSSQTAIRMTDGQVPAGSRLFQRLPRYTAAPFRANHLRILEAVYAMPTEYHSIRHLPNSFLNQILGEYGLLGLGVFLGGYLWFFLRRWKSLSWTRPVFFTAAAFLLFEYGFEYLSVLVFFELFFLQDLRRDADAPVRPIA